MDEMNIPHYGTEIKWIEKNYRFKATENGEILGTVEGKIEADVLYISALITKESARGRGIGTMLIEKAERFGKKLGARKTWLLTGKEWSENTFYKKLGFRISGELSDFFFHKDFVIYTRNIK